MWRGWASVVLVRMKKNRRNEKGRCIVVSCEEEGEQLRMRWKDITVFALWLAKHARREGRNVETERPISTFLCIYVHVDFFTATYSEAQEPQMPQVDQASSRYVHSGVTTIRYVENAGAK